MTKSTLLFFTVLTFFSFNTINAQYCTTSGSAGNGAFIGEVCFPLTSNPFNNCNQTNSGGIYGNYTGLGSRATYSPTPSAPNTNQVIVRIDRSNAGDYVYAGYIDFNQDQDFTDAGENVFMGSGNIPFATGGGSSFTLTITVPANASNGTTRMRIIAKDGTTPVGGPCETGFNGEAEDYTITITGGGVSCPTITFNATPSNEVCPGANNGNISVTAPAGGVGPYTYSINGGTTYQSSATFSGLAPNTYQVRVKDANDCESANQSVSIAAGIDNTPPVANCAAPFTIQLDSNGMASITAADIDSGSTDNCAVASATIDVTDFTCADVGPNTVTLTVTDVNGNFSTCTTTITVEDNVLPVANCAAPFTIQLDANGMAGITVADIDNGSTDACGIASTTIDVTDFTCADVGPNTVTLTVTDVNGNVSTCTTTITVEDNVLPVANCAAPFTIQLDSNGMASIAAADIDNGSTDNCAIASTTIDVTDFTCADVGPNTVTLTVTDVNGNFSTCTTTITVEDNVLPVANCAAPFTIQLDSNGMASITAADIDSGSTDNCAVASTTIDVTDFTCADVGPNTVTLTVTDVNGNFSTCTTTITVEDNALPVANCAAPFTIQLDANGMAGITVADIDNGSTDACGIASTTIDVTDFTCADVGPNTVTLAVTDVNGNFSTCTTTITVDDNIAPTIVCPANIMANTDAGECFATANFPLPIAFDNCGIDTVVQTSGLLSGSQFPVGVNTIEFTTTDVNGNVSTCNFNITVTDNEAPIAVCKNITIQLDANGNANITAADVDGGSTDQCGVASTTIDVDTFDCSNVGDNNVILTVTDLNGNVSSCTAIVTVEDVTAPVVACQNITVELDPGTGAVTITGADVDNGSTDACGIASYELDIDTFDCSNIGENAVVLTVTDMSGNVTTCTAIVTVEDNTAPVLVCQDFTLEIGADGIATLNPNDVIVSNDDACGILTVAVDITEFSCADIGNPIMVQVFSQDSNGNLATCTATVSAVDFLAPVLTCPADQTVDPGQGNLFYIVPDYFATAEATADDNCTAPVVITSQDPVAGTPLPDGVYTIMLTATDEYGNVGICDFELIVDSALGAGVNNKNLSSVTMYPVPAKNVLNIGNPQSLDLERLEIYDIRGRLVQTADLHGMGSTKPIDVNLLSAASYYVKIIGASGQITKRLLKE